MATDNSNTGKDGQPGGFPVGTWVKGRSSARYLNQVLTASVR